MASSLVTREAPEFSMDAYDPVSGKYITVSSEDYKGKWHAICFYPGDFTFVWPTELAAVNAALPKFEELGVELLVVSCDTKFSHKRFVETEPLMKDFKLKMGADNTHQVSKKFGVYHKDSGMAIRGRFLINPEGVVVAQEVLTPPVGRNVNEFIRQIQAFMHVEKTGEVTPAGWRPGKKTLPVNTDIEKMTGRVGDYITLDEILE